MKLDKIIYVPEARVVFDKTDVEIMCDASEHHYDLLCRQQSQVGGMLYGLRNQLSHSATAERVFDAGEIDLLCKIVERLSTAEPLLDKRVRGRLIQAKLGEIFRELNDDYIRLNRGQS